MDANLPQFLNDRRGNRFGGCGAVPFDGQPELPPEAHPERIPRPTPCGRNGVEFPLAGNVSANVEVRHTDYGQRTCDLTNPTYESLVDNSVRAGINYHFN